MRILVSFPGRAGDILWMLPTARAISEHYGVPVDLLIAGEFAGMVALLKQQAYLGHVVADPAWGMTHGWEPPNRGDVISPYDRTYHLGYRRWPEYPLPYETLYTAVQQWTAPELTIDLSRPWITLPPPRMRYDDSPSIVCGWSDCHFELKVGLVHLLLPRVVLAPKGSRWDTESHGCSVYTCDWLRAAGAIQNADSFLGDCSALHVLAVAMGKPVVLYEPMEARWNPIFYPLGKTGRVQLVTGNDGLPTTDSRHTANVLKEVLRG